MICRTWSKSMKFFSRMLIALSPIKHKSNVQQTVGSRSLPFVVPAGYPGVPRSDQRAPGHIPGQHSRQLTTLHSWVAKLQITQNSSFILYIFIVQTKAILCISSVAKNHLTNSPCFCEKPMAYGVAKLFIGAFCYNDTPFSFICWCVIAPHNS